MMELKESVRISESVMLLRNQVDALITTIPENEENKKLILTLMIASELLGYQFKKIVSQFPEPKITKVELPQEIQQLFEKINLDLKPPF